ncbi:MAG: molybdate ABC transporter substrate-binding protein [Armatimonadetes bacterium]|nr:molybdate ABC transporter substrate-binding protein [Armatimonadota bacterium]
MRQLRWVLAACLPALLVCGCAKRAEIITVQGGPSLGALFADLAAAYQADRPNARIVLKFSCPPCILYSSKGDTADFDLFASLGQFEVDRLSQEGVAQFEEPVAFGATTISIVATDTAVERYASMAALHREGTGKIGVGDPEKASVGHYTRQALGKAGLWDELQDRLVYAQSGCELLKWLGLGRDIEAAVVFSVCREDEGDAVRLAQELPVDIAPPVPILLAISRSAENPDGARSLIQFIRSPGAAEILARHHVVPVNQP